MERLTKFRILINIAIVTICLTVSNEVKSLNIVFLNPETTKIFIIALSITVSLLIEKSFIKLLVRVKAFRKYFFGKTWIEGYWIIDTYNLEDNIISSGIGEISYTIPNLEIQISGYFPIGIRTKKSTYSFSKDIYLREDDLLYVNYFTSNSSPKTLVGVAVGHFRINYNESFPKLFSGIIYYNDGESAVKQILKKIPEKEVEQLKKSENWKDEFVIKYGELYKKSK